MRAKKFQKILKIFKNILKRGTKPDFMRLCARLKISARLSQYEYIPLLSAESLIKIGVGRIDFYFFTVLVFNIDSGLPIVLFVG